MTPTDDVRLATWGLLPLRAVVGVVFLMHGGQKLFVHGLSGTAGAMGHMGIPLPALSAFVVIVVEFFGGLAVLVGFFTRVAGALLAIDMTVAVLAVRMAGGFFAPKGCEYELTLLGAALTLAAVGSGGASVDRLLHRRRTG